MSGIAGIIDLGGRPVSERALRAMADFMKFRGTDAVGVWVGPSVGLGHALLRTVDESEHETQPFTFDGRVWIAADARVDARAELIRELRAAGREANPSRPDVELILHAYYVWGEDSVKHLLGDFAFAVWDGRERKLFCARDHFGVKPFYYAETADCLLFSNTLRCLQQHPDVSAELNEQAVGDFLLFGLNQDLTTTIYAAVRRLPPAHRLVWRVGRPSIDRYWALEEGEIRFRRKGDYVERYRELLEAAVADRLRTRDVSILMSGGLDSTLVAAVARRCAAQGGAGSNIRAFTAVYESLILERERPFATLAAESLGIPIHFVPVDQLKLFELSEESQYALSEPYDGCIPAVGEAMVKAVGEHSRVVLTGEGGDPTMYFPMQPHLVGLVKRFRLLRAGIDAGRHFWHHRRLPRLAFAWRTKRLRGIDPDSGDFPRWLRGSFAERLKLRERRPVSCDSDSARALGRAILNGPFWNSMLEQRDPGFTSVPVETRHPLIDVRVVQYLLSIPAVPWAINKLLMREAARGILPEAIRGRRKCVLPGSPILSRIERGDLLNRDGIAALGQVSGFVDAEEYRRLAGTGGDLAQDMRPMILDFWRRRVSTATFCESGQKEYSYVG